jgi:hypothetical protein
VIVWDEKLETPAAVPLHKQRRSPSLGVTTPLHASLGVVLLIAMGICPMAKRPLDLETGYQRLRLQRRA